ncbi:hypothetical protein ADUPG1_005976, partial [Aduncisulcus paluster]
TISMEQDADSMPLTPLLHQNDQNNFSNFGIDATPTEISDIVDHSHDISDVSEIIVDRHDEEPMHDEWDDSVSIDGTSVSHIDGGFLPTMRRSSTATDLTPFVRIDETTHDKESRHHRSSSFPSPRSQIYEEQIHILHNHLMEKTPKLKKSLSGYFNSPFQLKSKKPKKVHVKSVPTTDIYVAPERVKVAERVFSRLPYIGVPCYGEERRRIIMNQATSPIGKVTYDESDEKSTVVRSPFDQQAYLAWEEIFKNLFAKPSIYEEKEVKEFERTRTHLLSNRFQLLRLRMLSIASFHASLLYWQMYYMTSKPSAQDQKLTDDDKAKARDALARNQDPSTIHTYVDTCCKERSDDITDSHLSIGLTFLKIVMKNLICLLDIVEDDKREGDGMTRDLKRDIVEVLYECLYLSYHIPFRVGMRKSADIIEIREMVFGSFKNHKSLRESLKEVEFRKHLGVLKQILENKEDNYERMNSFYSEFLPDLYARLSVTRKSTVTSRDERITEQDKKLISIDIERVIDGRDDIKSFLTWIVILEELLGISFDQS